MKIAIMQPYFIPYGGYFRLFCAADLFVVYDCVQFPRRSWVHRNQLRTSNNELSWLTLPLLKQPMDVLIKELAFRPDAQSEWDTQLSKFPCLQKISQKWPALFEKLTTLDSTPMVSIVKVLQSICEVLQLPFNIAFSSEAKIDQGLKGQDRILALINHYGGNEYINSPGGRALYQEEIFKDHGIKLVFLADYQGGYHSILQSMIDQDEKDLKRLLSQHV